MYQTAAVTQEDFNLSNTSGVVTFLTRRQSKYGYDKIKAVLCTNHDYALSSSNVQCGFISRAVSITEHVIMGVPPHHFEQQF